MGEYEQVPFRGEFFHGTAVGLHVHAVCCMDIDDETDWDDDCVAIVLVLSEVSAKRIRRKRRLPKPKAPDCQSVCLSDLGGHVEVGDGEGVAGGSAGATCITSISGGRGRISVSL